MKRKAFLLSLLLLLLLVQGVQAMESTNFSLDWFTLIDSSGGDHTSSEHYAANYTIGQTVIGPSTSPNYHAGLGYWYGLITHFFIINLPFIAK